MRPAQGGSGGTGSPGVRGIGSLGADDTPSAPVVQTAPGAKPAQSESSPEDYKQKDFYDFLLNAGLNILASDSPYFGQAIGEGGVAGLKSVKDAQNQRYDRARQEYMDRLTEDQVRSGISQGERRLDQGDRGLDNQLRGQDLQAKIAQMRERGLGKRQIFDLIAKYDIAGANMATQLEVARISSDGAARRGAYERGNELADTDLADLGEELDAMLGVVRDSKGNVLDAGVSNQIDPTSRAEMIRVAGGLLGPNGPARSRGEALSMVLASEALTREQASTGKLWGGDPYENLSFDASKFSQGGGGQPDGRYVPGQGLVRPGAQ